MSTTYNTPLQSTSLYLRRQFLKLILSPIIRLLMDVQIIGLENVPEDVHIICPNHNSLFEPPLVLFFWPRWPESIGAADVWNRPGQGAMARIFGGIPLKRYEFDRQALEQALEVLEAGLPLLIAPEGGRSPTVTLRRGKPGVAYLADHSGVPVVPVAVEGTYRELLKDALKLKRPRVVIHIGAPIHLPPLEGRGATMRASRQRNADRIMLEIAKKLPPDYHGAYAGLHIPEDA